MRSYALIFTAGLLISPAFAEPVEVLGGEIIVGDGIGGVDLDIDGDGVIDLNFAYFGILVNSIFAWDAIVRSGDGISDTQFAMIPDFNKVFVHPRLMAGDVVDMSIINGSVFGKVGYEAFFDGTFGGDWLDFERGYVAFSFRTDFGKGLNYGWAEVSIDQSKGTDDGFLIVHAVAYEDEPDTPIEAGAGAGGCSPADLNGDGFLNFGDVSLFLTMYGAMDPGADFTDDGLFNFGDVSAFLLAYGAGCP